MPGSLEPDNGTVVTAGPGMILDNGEYLPLPVSMCDKVMFGGDFKEIKIDNVRYLIMRSSNIYLKLQ